MIDKPASFFGSSPSVSRQRAREPGRRDSVRVKSSPPARPASNHMCFMHSHRSSFSNHTLSTPPKTPLSVCLVATPSPLKVPKNDQVPVQHPAWKLGYVVLCMRRPPEVQAVRYTACSMLQNTLRPHAADATQPSSHAYKEGSICAIPSQVRRWHSILLLPDRTCVLLVTAISEVSTSVDASQSYRSIMTSLLD